VGKSRVLLCKLIHEDFITLRCFLFQVDFQNETTLFILFLITTIATNSSERLVVLVQIQIVSAGWAKVCLFHIFLFCAAQI